MPTYSSTGWFGALFYWPQRRQINPWWASLFPRHFDATTFSAHRTLHCCYFCRLISKHVQNFVHSHSMGAIFHPYSRRLWTRGLDVFMQLPKCWILALHSWWNQAGKGQLVSREVVNGSLLKEAAVACVFVNPSLDPKDQDRFTRIV